jgi:signal transduction histidine kinase
VTQSDRLIRLVGDLLKLARLEAASESQSKPKTSTQLLAADLCARATAATRSLFDERGVVLRTQCTDFSLCGDGDLLEQLIINLLANAARHSNADTTTTLCIYQEAGQAVLQVRDEGCGIAEEHLPRLGERFYRVEEGRERAQRGHDSGGSGLGLAICRRIAFAHGGQLHISSEVGQGTVVTVTLPN